MRLTRKVLLSCSLGLGLAGAAAADPAGDRSRVGAAGVHAPDPADERAVEIALRALDAIERGWAIGAYGDRARVSVNARGASGFGATMNVVIDPPGRRWRLDAGGDVGPLALAVRGDAATLHVPGLAQWARRRAGALARVARPAASIAAEIAAMRARLRAGYPGLVYRGEEAVHGVSAHRIDDTAAPGTTVSFWIDAGSDLPRRIAVDRHGGGDVRIDLRYGEGPVPIRIEATISKSPPIRVVATLHYDGAGRVRRIDGLLRSGGSELEADVTVRWSTGADPGFFDLEIPAPARRVAFAQLARGIALQAAGSLGPIVRGLLGR
ncbi:MAG: hypothetical protein R3199_08330 [Gemmatimonadota bacterium]|nr:hypothetical protein [Gemmatimonadota bacterium]